MFWPAGIDAGVGLGLDETAAIRGLVILAGVLALALCLIPILVVDEHRFARTRPSELPLRQALVATFRNRPFLLSTGPTW